MMQRAFVTILFSLALLVIPIGSYGQNITVDFGGVCAQKSGPSPLDISGVCGLVTIAPNSTGLARVEIGTDASDDTLSLKNAKITATGGPVTDFHITFWRDFSQQPTTPPDAWYYLTVVGSIKRGALPAQGDSIRLNGYVKDPSTTGQWVGIGPPYPTGTQLSKSITCPNLGCESINLETNSAWSYLCSQGDPACLRTLKGEFWFTLTNTGDVLRLNPVSVHNGPPPGGPCDDTPRSPCAPPTPN